MTVTSPTNKGGPYNGDSSTVIFTVPFYFLAASDLLVTRKNADGTETTLVLTTDYSVSGAGNPAGGSITCVVAPVTGTKITISRNMSIVQGTTFPAAGLFPAATVEQRLDALTMMMQQLNEKIARAITLQVSSTASNPTLADPSANKTLMYDATGANIIAGPDSSQIIAAQGYATTAQGAASTALGAQTGAQTAQAAAEAAAAGMKWRPSVKLATTANDALSGLAARDGVTPIAGDRVLVRAQTSAPQNGVYIAASGAWTRATDADTWTELIAQVVNVEEGTANADLTYICTVNQGGTLGVTDVTWTTLKIPVNSVANNNLAQMAAHTFKGNNTGSTANAADLTATQLTAELDAMVGDSGSGGTKGLVPAPAAGDAAAGKVLGAGGTYVLPASITKFTDSQQTIPAGGATLTRAHGLGAAPFDYFVIFHCITAEFGYAIGDEIKANQDLLNISDGFMLWADATNINFIAGSGGNILLMIKSTGAQQILTKANWKIILKAWR